MTQQPNNTDAILGGQNLPNSVVLGGVEGLRQRLKLATPEQKIDLLTDTLNYDANGINLLINLLDDAELKVRVTACELLSLIDSEKASSAIAQGVRLNPGDRIYHVYESAIGYNDDSYYLITDFAGWRVEEWGSPKLISSYSDRDKAEIEALIHHQKRAHSLNLLDFERDDREFNLEQWIIENRIFDRQPEETVLEFSERLRQIFEATGQTNLIVQLWQDFQRENFDIDRWFAALAFFRQSPDETDCELETKIVKALKALQYHDKLGELWLETIGELAFVDEETVTEAKYVHATEFL
ncbi:hypothetical protein ACQ4M3_33240 [Leptolyngbya sp. AN03gr2]|uniref:hypothetical protein n=1 Tax=unclassified Leptolyngbya TaxID=2650499 RepID=UPI003D324632